MALTTRQEAFVAAYLTDPNATAAARVAGYKQPASQGPRLLQNVEIAARIGHAVAAVALTPDAILRELGALATANWQQTIDPRAGMAGKIKALELLGKYHKLFTDRTEITGKDGAPLAFTIVIDRRDGHDSEGDA